MTDLNAHVTVDDDGQLTDGSVVTVNLGGGNALEIPIPPGGDMWERINTALAGIGWAARAGSAIRYGQGRMWFRADEEGP